MPAHQFVTLEDTQLLGTTQSYSCSLEQISDFRHEMRIQFWRDFLSRAPAIPPVLYGLNETRPSFEKMTSRKSSIPPHSRRNRPAAMYRPRSQSCCRAANMSCLPMKASGTGVQEFILTVYGTCMPMLNLTRRKGQDIERYYPAEDAKAGDRPINLRCEFLIPIRR